MAKLTSIELLDGSQLVFAGPLAPNVARELEAWALVPEAGDDDAAREASVWAGALEAGPLLYVAFSGIVGNAAWSVFPAAAHYLRAHLARKAPPLDAPSVGSRAREAAAQALGIVESELKLVEARREGEGTWRATLRTASGQVATVQMDPAGIVTHVRVRTP